MNTIAVAEVTSPVAEQDLYLVRGDVFEFAMGFTDMPEVLANPSAYRLRMVFRQRQSDVLPELLSGTAVLDLDPLDSFNGVKIDVGATFTFQPAQTQTLPRAGCVYFIEWTDAIGQSNRRVVQGRILVED